MASVAVSPALPLGRRTLWAAALVGAPASALLWWAGPARWLPPMPLATLAGGPLLLLLTISIYTDLTRRRIYNWATYTLFLYAVLFNAAAAFLPADQAERLGAVGLKASLQGAAVGFFLTLLAYQLSGGGAGDVKLAAAVGAWLGPWAALEMLVACYAVGGATLAGWMVWTHGPGRVFGPYLRKIGSWAFPGLVAAPTPAEFALLERGVPMAPFFAFGALVALLGMEVL